MYTKKDLDEKVKIFYEKMDKEFFKMFIYASAGDPNPVFNEIMILSTWKNYLAIKQGNLSSNQIREELYCLNKKNNIAKLNPKAYFVKVYLDDELVYSDLPDEEIDRGRVDSNGNFFIEKNKESK